MLTARSENFLHGRPDLDDTLARLQAFQEVGADVLYAPGITDIEVLRNVVRSVDLPVNALARPHWTVAELAEAGRQSHQRRRGSGGDRFWALPCKRLKRFSTTERSRIPNRSQPALTSTDCSASNEPRSPPQSAFDRRDRRPTRRPSDRTVRAGWASRATSGRVHPTRNEVGGRSAYRSLDELPGVPDAAFVAINRKLTVEAVHQLAAMGVGGAVLYASGFAEAGPNGVSLQQELIEGHDMPLIGPNCYGTINALNGAAMWPDVHGCSRVDRGPALIGQSGNITLNMTLNQRGVDFAYALSLGNQASVAIEDCVLHLAADPRVTVIGIYLESITDSAAFGRAATAALESGTPIVVLKTGRSTTAGIISASHTAAMSSSSDAYSAALRALRDHRGEHVACVDDRAFIRRHHRGPQRQPADLTFLFRRVKRPW